MKIKTKKEGGRERENDERRSSPLTFFEDSLPKLSTKINNKSRTLKKILFHLP